MNQVSVLMASLNTGMRQSLAKLVDRQPWIDLFCVCGAQARIVTAAKNLTPQVIVLDVELAGEALEIGRDIQTVSPGSKIIILSSYDYAGKTPVAGVGQMPEHIFAAVEWLPNKAQPTELLKTIEVHKRHIH